MTYKSAVAGINLGGGKSVIIGDNKRADREALFRAHGRFVETLGGRYITAEDIGTSPADMEYIKLETDHVAGLLGLSGDPSPVTGYGVYVGMKAAAKERWGSDSLAGKTVAVQGAGKVAYYLCRHLHAEGAKLIVTDIDAEKVQAGGAGVRRQRRSRPRRSTTRRPTSTRPCAWAPRSTTRPCRGSRWRSSPAAPTTSWPRTATATSWRSGASSTRPDYVINGGGVINVYGELHRWPAERAQEEGGGDLRDPAPYLRDRPAGADPDLPRGRPAGRAADRGGGGAGPDVDGGASRRGSGARGRTPTEQARPITIDNRGTLIPHCLTARRPLPRCRLSCTLPPMPEVIPIGADHAGFQLKERLVEELRALGYEPLDLGHPQPGVDRLSRLRPPASRPGWSTTTRAAGCCSAAPGWACRTRPTATRACGPRWPGRPRSPGSPGSTTTPTSSSSRRAS